MVVTNVFFGLWVFINLFAPFIVLITVPEGGNCSFVNPIVIYKNLRVNWFGAIFLALILNILLPVISVCYWFYKLCTVGRK